MTEEQFKTISNQMLELKDLPNTQLVDMLDKISEDYDLTKNNLINMTYYLDNLEIMYNSILKEYSSRTNL